MNKKIVPIVLLGMVTCNMTTGPSYHPYMRKKNFWNLHYGLTQ